jgi:hypothetical protein
VNNPYTLQIETSAKSHFVILSAAKDLVFTCSDEILQSLRSLRMTGEGTFTEVSNCYNGRMSKAAIFHAPMPKERAAGRAAQADPDRGSFLARKPGQAKYRQVISVRLSQSEA